MWVCEYAGSWSGVCTLHPPDSVSDTVNSIYDLDDDKNSAHSGRAEWVRTKVSCGNWDIANSVIKHDA